MIWFRAGLSLLIQQLNTLQLPGYILRQGQLKAADRFN